MYRDASTAKPKQLTVASLGRLDQLNTELNSVIAGLQRVTGQTPASTAAAPPILSFDQINNAANLVLQGEVERTAIAVVRILGGVVQPRPKFL